MKVHDKLIQGTDEWYEVRRGKITASKAGKLFMAPSTKGYQDFINEAVYKIYTGKYPDTYQNEWMQRGTEMEPEARRHYELTHFVKVHEVGFVEMSERVGCSPDGLIGDHGLIQIKCQKYNTHIEQYNSGKIQKDYLMQMQFEMMVTGRQWNIFYAYHPDLPAFEKKILRDNDIIKDIKARIETAFTEIDKRVQTLKGTPTS